MQVTYMYVYEFVHVCLAIHHAISNATHACTQQHLLTNGRKPGSFALLHQTVGSLGYRSRLLCRQSARR